MVVLGNSPRVLLFFKYQEARNIRYLKGSDGTWLHVGGGQDWGFLVEARAVVHQVSRPESTGACVCDRGPDRASSP